MACATWCCATSTWRAPTRRVAPGSPRPTPRTSSRSRARPRSASGPSSRGSAPTNPRPAAPDCPPPDGSCLRDYIQVSDLAAPHLDALTYLRGGGESLILNCGYGRGYSVLEVIDVVKRVSGRDFPVRLSPRRPGDPAAIVAQADRIRERLGWRPRFDDLNQIVAQALAWERSLKVRNHL